MKRYSGLHDKLCTIENIEVADDNARKNKNKKYGINKHDKNRQYENEDFLMILDEIIDSTDNVRDVSSKLTNKIGMAKELILLNIMVNTLE